jgi:hypothetical protein
MNAVPTRHRTCVLAAEDPVRQSASAPWDRQFGAWLTTTIRGHALVGSRSARYRIRGEAIVKLAERGRALAWQSDCPALLAVSDWSSPAFLDI